MSAQSCDQLCSITADHISCHAESTDDQIALMISVAQLCHLLVSISAMCQCSSMPPTSAHQCHVSAIFQCLPPQCTSMPHISAHLSCLSVSPISASQCHLSMPVSATYQCCQPVPPISASHQCRLLVCISAAYQCPSVLPISAT
ncbi:unnamed protein product [Staurois parvus]|uniref:Uncharacterized protein n=1 Tax=Staurois parvus TaxID=386267 RepID=A0ABN9HNR5_9NEOB|nr:unnamed protein product [Staurois parvus]